MACGGVPMTEKTWYEHMMRQQHAMAGHSSPFAAAPAGHVSAAGHYGYQPPAQMDHQMADKENAAMEFHHGMWPSPTSAVPGGHGSGIGPVGGCLGVRKRGRDEVLFQEFKRRRLTEPEALAMAVEPAAPPPPAPVAPAPAPVGHESPAPLLTPGVVLAAPTLSSSAEEMRSAVAASAHYDRLYAAAQADALIDDHGC